VIADVAAGSVGVKLGKGRVVGRSGREEDVVDGTGQPLEEALQRRRIGGVECRNTGRADIGCGLFEAIGIAAREDDVGSLGSCPPRRLETDAGAAADDDDGLPRERAHPAVSAPRTGTTQPWSGAGGANRGAVVRSSETKSAATIAAAAQRRPMTTMAVR